MLDRLENNLVKNTDEDSFIDGGKIISCLFGTWVKILYYKDELNFWR